MEMNLLTILIFIIKVSGKTFLKDNSTGNFLKPSEFPKFDSMDDFNGFNQMNSSQIYLLKDFDIKNYLDI